jgi:hypothetical protein
VLTSHFILKTAQPNAVPQKKGVPLEREIDAGSKHAEIILRPIDHIPTKVICPTDVPGESKLKTATELTHYFRSRTEVLSLGIDEGYLALRGRHHVGDFLSGKGVSLAAAENRANSCPRIRRETRARNRIAQRKCPQYRADHATIGSFFGEKDSVKGTRVDVEASTFGIEGKPFDPDAEITMKEIFDVCASTPGVIAPKIFIKGPENGVTLVVL